MQKIIKLSQFPFDTLKSKPKISDNYSTSLLLQGSYIRQVMAGAYEFLPMGYRVLKKIEDIIKEEMDNAGYQEMLMTILTPRELWETTNRWEIPEYFKVPAWGTSQYRISPTNEENISNIMKEFINSYKDLPTCVYHIQKKFRNEKRAKSGLLRGREFLMKDAYSFHKDVEDFDKFYEEVKKVYMKIFERLGLGKDTVIADADGGAISDKNSHEFQTILEIGEDTIVQDSSGYCYNLEIASGVPDEKNLQDAEKEMEYIDSVEDIVNMEKMAAYFNAPDRLMLKTVVYKTESGKFFSIIIRGDLNVNEIKVRKFINQKYGEDFKQASLEDLEKLGTVRGFISPLKDSKLDMINFADESLKTVKNFFAAANKIAKSVKNVNIKDLDISTFGDFSEPVEGFTSKNIPGEKLSFKKASEVGNIFHLGTKYSKPFGLSYLDQNGKQIDEIHMGCYGIGVSRLMGVIGEYFMHENGINWPENIAPVKYYILVLGEGNVSKAEKIAEKLVEQGNDVIIDDRIGKQFGFGKKAGDCELWGIPNRIVISDKTVEKGGYELKNSKDEQFINFNF